MTISLYSDGDCTEKLRRDELLRFTIPRDILTNKTTSEILTKDFWVKTDEVVDLWFGFGIIYLETALKDFKMPDYIWFEHGEDIAFCEQVIKKSSTILETKNQTNFKANDIILIPYNDYRLSELAKITMLRTTTQLMVSNLNTWVSETEFETCIGKLINIGDCHTSPQKITLKINITNEIFNANARYVLPHFYWSE